MPVARDYLGRRGVNEELKRAFYVGSAPASWDALAIHLLEKKAPVDLAVELGLIRPSQKRKPGQPPYFDLFRNRVIFPILDMRGKVVGFGGRSLPTEESSDSDGPKYLNSSGSFVFEKEKVVFGLPQAVKHIRDLNEVILVEGYFDVLALHAAGFCNAVATCGTSLTAQHLAAFRRFAGKVTVLFDGDKAGMAATERAMELGLDHGLVLHGAAMPEGLDPDEVIFDPETGESTAGGKGRMAAILGGAKPLLDTRIDQEVRLAVDGPEARTQALKRVAGWLSRFRDQLGREIRMQTVQEGLGVSRDLLMRAMGADSQPGVGGRTVSVRPPAVGRVNVDRSREVTRPGKRVRGQGLSEGDRILLEALVCPGDSHRWLSEVRNRLPSEGTLSELFDYPPAGEFVVRLVDGAGVSEHFLRSPEAYIDPTLDAQVRSTLTKAMVCTEVAWDAGQLKRAIQRAVARCWLRFARRIEMELDGPEAKKDKELQSRLMKEFLDVQRRLKEFKRFYEQA
jgi:DNA primase catalytic core